MRSRRPSLLLRISSTSRSSAAARLRWALSIFRKLGGRCIHGTGLPLEVKFIERCCIAFVPSGHAGILSLRAERNSSEWLPNCTNAEVRCPRARRVSTLTGGTSGGTPRDKDQEIRVRMGNFRFRPCLRHGTRSGVLCREYVDNKGFNLAPQVGFEPTTLRLTAT
jgi:hypothetical protein